MSKQGLELGGMIDANGNLGKPVPSGHVLVPGRIELKGDSIQWEIAGPARPQEISPSTLNEFVKLWSGTSTEILRFARRWGVLAIQGEGAKSIHSRPCGESMPQGSDPIAAWKYYSRRAFAALNIAAGLRQGKLGDLADWGVIAASDEKGEFAANALEQDIYGMGYCLFPERRGGQSAVEDGRRIIGIEATKWLSFWRSQRRHGVSDFSVRWRPDTGQWLLEVDYHGYLFAAIALQLALCIAGADALYTCSGCGSPYVREAKRPKPGTANYCGKCSGKGVAQRRAVDAYREKKVEAIRLESMGVSPSEIALQLNTPLPRLTKWLVKKKRVTVVRRKRTE
jgi:hypothetical protein